MCELSSIKKIELQKTITFGILKHSVFVTNILKTENDVKSIGKFFEKGNVIHIFFYDYISVV